MLLSIFIGNNHVFSIGLWSNPTLETIGVKVNKGEFQAYRRRINPFASAQLFNNAHYGIGEIVDYVSFIPFFHGFTPYDLECSKRVTAFFYCINTVDALHKEVKLFPRFSHATFF